MVFQKKYIITHHQIHLNLKNYQKHMHIMMKTLKKHIGKH